MFPTAARRSADIRISGERHLTGEENSDMTCWVFVIADERLVPGGPGSYALYRRNGTRLLRRHSKHGHAINSRARA